VYTEMGPLALIEQTRRISSVKINLRIVANEGESVNAQHTSPGIGAAGAFLVVMCFNDMMESATLALLRSNLPAETLCGGFSQSIGNLDEAIALIYLLLIRTGMNHPTRG
jgi:hypothetical protein